MLQCPREGITAAIYRANGSTCFSVILPKATTGISVMKRLWGKMRYTLPIVICILALAGLADSIYLSLAHFGLVDLHTSAVANVCKIGSGGCEEALTSNQAAVFGIPTALLGAIYFMLFFGAAITRTTFGTWPRPLALGAMMAAGLAFSIYLLHLLFFEMSAPCPYCVAAHGINIAALALCIVSFGQDGLLGSAGRYMQTFTRNRAPSRWRTQP